MGWLIFGFLMLVGSICVGCDKLVKGDIKSGICYIIIPVCFVAIVVVLVIIENKQQKQKKLVELQENSRRLDDRNKKLKKLLEKRSPFFSKYDLNKATKEQINFLVLLRGSGYLTNYNKEYPEKRTEEDDEKVNNMCVQAAVDEYKQHLEFLGEIEKMTKDVDALNNKLKYLTEYTKTINKYVKKTNKIPRAQINQITNEAKKCAEELDYYNWMVENLNQQKTAVQPADNSEFQWIDGTSDELESKEINDIEELLENEDLDD